MHEYSGDYTSPPTNPTFAAIMATSIMLVVGGAIGFWYFVPETFYVVCIYIAGFAGACLGLWALVKVWLFLYELFL